MIYKVTTILDPTVKLFNSQWNQKILFHIDYNYSVIVKVDNELFKAQKIPGRYRVKTKPSPPFSVT